MNREHELQERLKRIAENIRFSHYVVCTFCRSPIILLGDEAKNAGGRVGCETCQGIVDYNAVTVRLYPP